MAEARLEGVELIVNDMAASVAFYRRLGIEFPDGAENEVHLALRLANGIELSFDTEAFTTWGFDPNWKRGTGTINCLQFSLPSREAVDEIYAELTGAGYTGHLPPNDAFWGARYAIVDDPDGNAVGFHSPRDMALSTGPPSKFDDKSQ